MFSLGMFTVNTSLAVYIIFPLLGFFLGLLFLPKFWRVKNEFTVMNEFLAPIRERRQEACAKQAELLAQALRGSEKVRQIAAGVVDEMKTAMKIKF